MKRATIELELAPEMEKCLRVIANNEKRSIESILQEGLALLFGDDSVVEYQLDRLSACTDKQLWTLVYQRLTATQDTRLRELLNRGSAGALTYQEAEEMQVYVDMVDRQMLLRSRSLALLKERGHDIDVYLNGTAEAP